jgi:spore coat protein A
MVSRRSFVKLTAAGVAGLYVSTRTGRFVLHAQIPGGTLSPGDIAKYQTPLLIPPVMPSAGKISQKGRAIEYYEISVRQFQQQILPAGMPATTVWGYGSISKTNKPGLLLHNAPSLTIEARVDQPVRVKWINDLVDGHGNYLPHILPVDPTLHWANPPGGVGGSDMRPAFAATPPAYTGPVPIVTHVHGAVGVGAESDGYPEAWYLPDAANIPAGYARTGRWYQYFRRKAADAFGTEWGPGFATFEYPNNNRASTIWYHDHTLGMTRLNVYAGPAGFYILRGGPAGDGRILDSRSGLPAVLPAPWPQQQDQFPSNKTYYEIPIVIQDRSFNIDGSLFFPDTRAFFDGFEGPYIPGSNVSPIWNPEFFGNCMMVNGNTWPYLDVEQRRYRLRFLNGCNSRFLILDFSQIPGVEVWQIGNEGGLLAAPVNLTAANGNQLLLALAERADLVVDFTNVPPGRHVLGNIGPDEPFGGGEPPDDFDSSDPESTGQIMQFRVRAAVSADPTTPPKFMVLPPIPPLPAETSTRRIALLEKSSDVHDGPAEALLGTVDEDGMAAEKMWGDPITENPAVGTTELWEIYNFTVDAHPIHVHEVTFEIVNRQRLVRDGEEAAQPVQLAGDPRPPEAWEDGRKDMAVAYPGEVTRIRARFETPGRFVWHCHIVDHEDNEMMRPYQIGPEDPEAPDAT